MIPMVMMDLDEPWGPEEAGRDLDLVPPFVILMALKAAHEQIHESCAAMRSRMKRRPWKWHKLRKLREDERGYCREIGRRAKLVEDVVRAHRADPS